MYRTMRNNTAGGIPYTLVRSQRKTLAIQITPDGRVVVRCPARLPQQAAEDFLKKKADWIRKKLETRNSPKEPPFTQPQLRAYAERTKALLGECLPGLAGKLGVSYGRVTVRAQRTRWGSCSSKGNLNFNCLLALVPPEVFSYVVIHELCHLKELNHSARFWAEVAAVMPEWKQRKAWLKDHGTALIGRLP